MLGEVQYGGRVTDDFDKRLLNTYARVWFSQEMFKETFKFYQGYNIPRCAQIADFKAHIDEMPLSDTPEVIDVYRNRVLFRYITKVSIGTNRFGYLMFMVVAFIRMNSL